MSKPRIAVVLDKMSVGGIPVACISFLREISQCCNVTLVLSGSEGEFADKIPEGVDVRVYSPISASAVFKGAIKREGVFACLPSLVKYVWHGKLTRRWIKAARAVAKYRTPIFEEPFDIAIAYHGMNVWQMNRVLFEIPAKKKIAWIHGDHSFARKHIKDAELVYRGFDKIFCVSECTKKRFLSDFPSLSGKCEVYYNHFPVEEIREKSNAYSANFSDEYTNVVTVGRVSPEKGQDLIPNAAKLLLERGHKIRWYVVGDGDDRARIEGLIDEAGVRDAVIMLGNKTNPYPYIKACDVYVQPSYTEGFPLAIFEAAILDSAIVATNVGGTAERLSGGEEIILVEPNANSTTDGIERLLTDGTLWAKLKKNIAKRDFSNKEEIEKIMSILNQQGGLENDG